MSQPPEFEPFTPYRPLFLVRNRRNTELVKQVEAMTEEEWKQYVEEHEQNLRDA